MVSDSEPADPDGPIPDGASPDASNGDAADAGHVGPAAGGAGEELAEPSAVPAEEPESTGDGDALLAQWQERLGGGEDPMAALAGLLSGRVRRRAELFSRVGQQVLGYRLEQILGAGGSGVTYAARAAGGEQAAVKLVVLGAGSAEARFEREGQLLQVFRHSAIVGYRAHAMIEPGVGALVMDLVDGSDLEQVLLEVDAGAP